MPGKPSELLTWFGKSERPVATTAAPASSASQGQISGTGLAQAKTIESLTIALIHSGRITPGPDLDRAITTSAFFIASGISPSRPSALVMLHSFHLSLYSALRI